jgi:hypothetical protein
MATVEEYFMKLNVTTLFIAIVISESVYNLNIDKYESRSNN